MKPYVCTYDECPTPEHVYASKRDWVDHEREFHRRRWACHEPDHSARYESPVPLRYHFLMEHSDTIAESQIDTVVALSNSYDDAWRDQCPFCLAKNPIKEDLDDHITSHMEHLALISILVPPLIYWWQ